jgi:hypothetical protein
MGGGDAGKRWGVASLLASLVASTWLAGSTAARAPQSIRIVARPEVKVIEHRCREITGIIENVMTQSVHPARFESTIVNVTLRPTVGTKVTVTLGALPDVAAAYGDLRVGQLVSLHCSAPHLHFLRNEFDAIR